MRQYLVNTVRSLGATLPVMVLFLVPPTARADSVFVDGTSLSSTFWGFVANKAPDQLGLEELKNGNDIRNYLLNSRLGQLVKDADPNVLSVPFAGQIFGTDSLDAARAVLTVELKIKADLAKKQPTTLYAHSFGTIIAWRALMELQSDPAAANLQVKLVTFNSPLGRNPNSTWGTALKGWLNAHGWVELTKDIGKVPKPSNVMYWVNVWAAHDPISGVIEHADENIQFDKDVPADLKNWLFMRGQSSAVSSGVDAAVGDLFFWHKASYGPADVTGKQFDLKVPEANWAKISPLKANVVSPATEASGITTVNIGQEFYRPPQNTFPIGQCTWFVYGRMKELRLTGLVNVLDSKGSGRDAKNWLGWAKQAGLPTGVEPRQNSIACWTNLGHVAFVEEATPDGKPRVTESNAPIPKTLRVIAMQMTDGKQKPMLLFLDKDEAQEVGEVPIGQTRSIKSLGDLSSGREGLCQVAAAQDDFDARAGQLNMPSEKYIASSEGKRFAPWARRYWTSAAFEGNFTGIRLSPDAPAYGQPDHYIYLDTAAPTGPAVATVAGSVVLKLRSDVSMTQPVVASVAEGTTMQVVQGPVQSGEFVWWKLTGKPGEGWAAVKTKPNTIFQAPKDCPVEVTANFLWFHGSLKAQGTFYVATHDNVLMKQPSATSDKIKDLPVGTEDTVIGGPTSADGRMWWNLTVGPDTGWAVVDRWGFSYPKD
jgi:surface antigen